jgi:Fur family transcriptional regulator, ferric uptake regulator
MPGIQDDLMVEQVHQMLRKNGSRVTPQREYVLEVFLKYKDDHLSAEDVYALLQRSGNTQISLATVYRTLKTLHELHILREVDLAQDHKHYELADEKAGHHHIICTNCDHHSTIEFESEEVNQLATAIAAQYNISVQQVELKIIGICNDESACQDRDVLEGRL